MKISSALIAELCRADVRPTVHKSEGRSLFMHEAICKRQGSLPKMLASAIRVSCSAKKEGDKLVCRVAPMIDNKNTDIMRLNGRTSLVDVNISI